MWSLSNNESRIFYRFECIFKCLINFQQGKRTNNEILLCYKDYIIPYN